MVKGKLNVNGNYNGVINQEGGKRKILQMQGIKKVWKAHVWLLVVIFFQKKGGFLLIETCEI